MSFFAKNNDAWFAKRFSALESATWLLKFNQLVELGNKSVQLV